MKRPVGMRPFSLKQVLKVYWLMFGWVGFIIYLIIRQATCGCLYLILGEGIFIMMLFGVSMVLTRSWYKRQEKKNLIYKDE